jgi:hypothetical protein
MNPRNAVELARLLDQVAREYPTGIPIELIRSTTPSTASVGADNSAGPKFHFFVSTTAEDLPGEERSLLENIATKGLKAGPEDFIITCAAPEVVESLALSSPAHFVVVFGSAIKMGRVEREDKPGVLFTHGLSRLVDDVTLKREVWDSLKELLREAF